MNIIRLICVISISTVLSISADAAVRIKLASTISTTGCTGNNYYLINSKYTNQQVEWLKTVFLFIYSGFDIDGCQFDEFGEKKVNSQEIKKLLENKKFQDFLGKQICKQIGVLCDNRINLMANKKDLEKLDQTAIYESQLVQTYLKNQKLLLDALRLRYKIEVTDNSQMDCD